MNAITKRPWLLTGRKNTGPPGKTLDLNFMNPGTLDPRITFTRASGAACIDASGFIQMAAVNAPRWDYDPVTHALRGVLIEEQRTNLALWSADFTQGAIWNNAAVGSGGVNVVTANQAVSPDGTTTASKIVMPAVSGAGNGSFFYQIFTAAAAPYTFSIWLRGNVGGEATYISINTGTTYYVSPRLILTAQWKRFTVVSPTLTAGTWVVQFCTDLRDTNQAATPAQTIYAWGAQVEQGAFPTSYIPTTSAAVTRAVDLPSIQPANMSPWFTPPGGSWFAEFVCAALTPNFQRVVYFPPINAATMIGSDSTAHAFSYDVGPVNASANIITANVVTKIASSWAAATGKICLNAGAVVTTGGMNNGFSGATSAGIGFMQAATAAPEIMSGYLRRAAYWPRILSDTEMQQVTT